MKIKQIQGKLSNMKKNQNKRYCSSLGTVYRKSDKLPHLNFEEMLVHLS